MQYYLLLGALNTWRKHAQSVWRETCNAVHFYDETKQGLQTGAQKGLNLTGHTKVKPFALTEHRVICKPPSSLRLRPLLAWPANCTATDWFSLGGDALPRRQSSPGGACAPKTCLDPPCWPLALSTPVEKQPQSPRQPVTSAPLPPPAWPVGSPRNCVSREAWRGGRMQCPRGVGGESEARGGVNVPTGE